MIQVDFFYEVLKGTQAIRLDEKSGFHANWFTKNYYPKVDGSKEHAGYGQNSTDEFAALFNT